MKRLLKTRIKQKENKQTILNIKLKISFFIISIISALMLNCSILNAQMTILPGSFITIKPAGSLYVGTTMNIKSNSSGSGYFVDQTNNNVTVTGNISVERYIQANGWHNVASPVSVANTNLYSTTDLVFYYDETKILNDWNFGWVWYQGALTSFKGYDVYLDASAITVNYTATNSSGLNTGSYSLGITKTDVPDGETENRKGWNLIGNPYPSPVDWLEEGGWDKTDINDAKYIWNPADDIYTIFLGGGAPVGINGGTQYIPSNQGFWVQATTTGSISINNSVRTGTMTSTPDYYKAGDFNYPIIRFLAKGNSLEDETVIRFIDGNSSGFNLNHDAIKLFSGSDKVPQISTAYGNLEFALNTYSEISDGMEVPMNFNCGTNGDFCIEIDERSNIGSIESIYLLDRITKNLINLSIENKYCFQHETSNIKRRFLVVINPSQDKLTQLKIESPFLVYPSYNTINIVNLTGEPAKAKIEVFNLLGQNILTKTISEDENKIQINSGPAYYIIRVTSNKAQYTSKIFLH